jgi:uncharacterized alkaline shock family protein YloU
MSHVIDGTTITDAALSQIVVAAAEQVDGARVRKRRAVEPVDGRVALSLAARQGGVQPVVAREVQQRVVTALATMCGLDVLVDVSVDELDAG